MEDNTVQDTPASHSQSKEVTVAIVKAPPSLQTMEDTGPVPLSFPSVLRHPGLTSRFAHLVGPPTPAPVQAKKVWRRNDNEGKRWVRRRENARFTDNPHIAVPSTRDLEPPLPTLLTTFPIPLPPYLPRSAPLPASTPPAPDAKASSAGQFSLSLRGMRKALRRSGARTEALVRGVEDELTRWLGEVAVVLNPALDPDGGHQFPGRAVAGEEGIREVERSPQRLVWWIENDTWARYVVHCCARYHNIVSFSKDTPTHRLTHILRPNVTRPDPATRATLATPPPTDPDFSSLSSHDSDQPSSLSDVQSIDGASDVLSEADFASDPESPTHLQRRRVPLSDIASDADADAETDADADVAGGGASELERAAEALSLANDDETPRRAPRFTTTYRTQARVWDHHCRGRSGSSPSRSPARRKPPRRPLGRVVPKKPTNDDGDRRESFYDYLFK
ncbi:hypothetical protein EDB85DRAFT_1974219 [Lactarius pseudohatsudake]|nr:hypothetical protein EDB85DRAFT_1974219 [Lactarius pseudohatsudake]